MNSAKEQSRCPLSIALHPEYSPRTSYSWWKTEVRCNPKDLEHIKRYGRSHRVQSFGAYRDGEAMDRACKLSKKDTNGFCIRDDDFRKLEKQIRSSLPTDHYELLYNDGTIINLPLFENEEKK